MASGIGSLLNLLGKVDSGNALVVVGTASAGTTGGTNVLSSLQGKVDASNALLVKFV